MIHSNPQAEGAVGPGRRQLTHRHSPDTREDAPNYEFPEGNAGILSAELQGGSGNRSNKDRSVASQQSGANKNDSSRCNALEVGKAPGMQPLGAATAAARRGP
ncbi:hypothetical protein EYF80_020625 [Liparis tanakae]|uniref:Uncharacterized protein n=1 Tax=Liparis tanakae TaxID=230148 RepID=A0A4Z2HTT2_9TELE|nr:hypothetical protein EYF80_020625 [Liparis tanakae]